MYFQNANGTVWLSTLYVGIRRKKVAKNMKFLYNIKKTGGIQDMAKLYFKYGAMGSSKTAQALITK